MTRLNCSPKITQNDFQETNHETFQKQQFRDVLQNKCSSEFCKNFQNTFFTEHLGDCFWHFIAIASLKRIFQMFVP